MRVTIRFGKRDDDIIPHIEKIPAGERSFEIKKMIRYYYSIVQNIVIPKNMAIVEPKLGIKEIQLPNPVPKKEVSESSVDDLLNRF